MVTVFITWPAPVFLHLVGIMVCIANAAIDAPPPAQSSTMQDDRSIGERCQVESEHDQSAFIPCVLRENKKLEIKRDLEALLPDMPTASRAPQARRPPPSDQLRHILRSEGFTDNMQLENAGQCPGPNCPEAQTSMIMLPAISEPSNFPSDHSRTYFNASSLRQFDIETAHINFFVRRLHGPHHKSPHHHHHASSKYTVLVYKYLSRDLIDTEPLATAQRSREMSHGGWDKMDVTDLVKIWSLHHKKNFGILVKIEQDGFETNPLGSSSDSASGDGTSSYLEVKVAGKRRSKHRRRSLPNQEGGDCAVDPKHNNGSCCRYPLEINFEEFGWDWIVAPRRYNAYYCAGYCRRWSTKPIQHASILAASGGHSMCCSPQSLSEMKLLYLDSQGNMHMKAVPNMIVQRCGCS